VVRLIWTPQALRDVTRLRGFLAHKNPDAAQRAVRTIRLGVKMLGRHPEVGRPVEEMPREFREFDRPRWKWGATSPVGR
jgi:plasmid stabilization system protein ParE